MNKDNNPIYVDKNGYNELLKKIEEVKESIQKNNLGRKAAFDAGAGDGWDSPEFEEIERKERMLSGELQRLYEKLSRVEIIEKHNDTEIVDIGDILVVDLLFSEDDGEEFKIKLVGGEGNFNNKIDEVSINSPLGNAVYKKKIGEKAAYKVNDNVISVYIKSKINTLIENNQKTKSLKNKKVDIKNE